LALGLKQVFGKSQTRFPTFLCSQIVGDQVAQQVSDKTN